MKRNLVRCTILFATLFISVLSCFGGIIETVSLTTTPLIGHPAGPFSLAFQFTDGSGVGDANNTVTLSTFSFGGGGASGVPTLFGGATGDVSSAVTLTDSAFLNFFIQPFTPGNLLTFTLSSTTNADAGGTPDEFAFSILDNSGMEIPTLGGPQFDVFVVVDLSSSMPAMQTFASDPTRSLAGGGGPITIAAPQVISDVPEPSSFVLFASALGVCYSIRKSCELWRLLCR
jgi:hypothetical protein